MVASEVSFNTLRGILLKRASIVPAPATIFTLPATGFFPAAYRRCAWCAGWTGRAATPVPGTTGCRCRRRRCRSRVSRHCWKVSKEHSRRWRITRAPRIDRCRGGGRGIKRLCKDQGRQNKQASAWRNSFSGGRMSPMPIDTSSGWEVAFDFALAILRFYVGGR